MHDSILPSPQQLGEAQFLIFRGYTLDVPTTAMGAHLNSYLARIDGITDCSGITY